MRLAALIVVGLLALMVIKPAQAGAPPSLELTPADFSQADPKFRFTIENRHDQPVVFGLIGLVAVSGFEEGAPLLWSVTENREIFGRCHINSCAFGFKRALPANAKVEYTLGLRNHGWGVASLDLFLDPAPESQLSWATVHRGAQSIVKVPPQGWSQSVVKATVPGFNIVHGLQPVRLMAGGQNTSYFGLVTVPPEFVATLRVNNQPAGIKLTLQDFSILLWEGTFAAFGMDEAVVTLALAPRPSFTTDSTVEGLDLAAGAWR